MVYNNDVSICADVCYAGIGWLIDMVRLDLIWLKVTARNS